MVDETKKIGSGLVDSLAGTPDAVKKKNDELGKDAFLQLLIAQLKNQDPENPADSKEMAVQLAQFTQVEKLISIDEKIGAQNQSSLGVAGFLGQDVVLDGSAVAVKDDNGGSLQFKLSNAASAVKVQFMNADGIVVKEANIGAMTAGNQEVSLQGVGLGDGKYKLKVTAVNATTGAEFSPQVNAIGRVTGFIPGADPTLIVDDGREIKLSDVKEVRAPKEEAPA